MRRLVLLLALLAALGSGCATAERPEGIVERWLISLNQGAAGHPDRYASAQVSRLVLPDRVETDPGAFDLIEVGRGRSTRLNLTEESYTVPFAVERLDGRMLRGSAILRNDGGGWRVEAVTLATFDLALPSEEGPAFEGARPVEWFAAAVVAIGLILLTVVLMRLVPERTPDLRTRPEG